MNGPVRVVTCSPSPLADAIVDGLVFSGATVASSDLTSGDIVAHPAERSQEVRRVPGYRLARAVDAERQVSRLIQVLGRIDGLVNVVTRPPNDAGWEEQFHRTFHPVLLFSRAVCSQWMLRHGGAITNVIAGSVDAPSAGGEVAEASVLAFTRELAAELAPFVDVNGIVVGPLDREVERLLEDSIVKRRTVRSALLRTVAQTAIDLQTAPQSARGTVVVLDPDATEGAADSGDGP